MDSKTLARGTQEQVRRRLELLVGARVVDRPARLAARERMDALRRSVPGFDGVAEVRRWRER